MKFDWKNITFLVCLGLSIVFGALVSVWQGFVIFLGLSLTGCALMFTIYSQQKYNNMKKTIAEMRYCDAYLYADEHNLEFDVDNFSYDKNTEKAFKTRLNNRLILAISGYSLIAICFALVVYGIIGLI